MGVSYGTLAEIEQLMMQHLRYGVQQTDPYLNIIAEQCLYFHFMQPQIYRIRDWTLQTFGISMILRSVLMKHNVLSPSIFYVIYFLNHLSKRMDALVKPAPSLKLLAKSGANTSARQMSGAHLMTAGRSEWLSSLAPFPSSSSATSTPSSSPTPP